ncbi:MAG: hypothetical protein J6I73_00185 [Treponema sp.]|nr:hypothetical protein [Treponema sp.]
MKNTIWHFIHAKVFTFRRLRCIKSKSDCAIFRAQRTSLQAAKLFVAACAALSCVAVLASSCKSSSVTQTVGDAYGDEQQMQTAVKVPAANRDAPRNVQVQQKGNALTRFFTGGQKDIELDQCTLSQKTVGGKLKLEDAIIIYNIETGLVGFSADYQVGTYHVLFNEATRRVFRAAVTSYLSDFENKTLIRNTKKTYKIYGECPTTIHWSTFTKQLVNHANSKVQFGYEFRNGSPFFSISVLEAENIARKNSRSTIETNVPLHFYFTKAQARELADLLSEEKIDAALVPYMNVMEPDGTPKADEYTAMPSGDEYTTE